MKYLLLTLILIISLFGVSQRERKVVEPNTNKPKSVSLNGTIDTLEIKSIYLNETRTISIYKPQKTSNNLGYGVLIVTDGVTAQLSNYVEYLIENNMIEPIIIVGINQRDKQPVDSILSNFEIDFRMKDLLKGEVRLAKNEEAYRDSSISKLISGRHSKFLNFVGQEVIPFIKNNYEVNNDKTHWTIGGFSNGGAFVYSFACTFPNLIGHSIVMSPGGFNDYDIEKSDCRFYICAGKHEPSGFINNSKQYLKLMKKKKISFLHRLYNSGHDWEMWLDFYIDRIRYIYQ